jgi:hypothetical protein
LDSLLRYGEVILPSFTCDFVKPTCFKLSIDVTSYHKIGYSSATYRFLLLFEGDCLAGDIISGSFNRFSVDFLSLLLGSVDAPSMLGLIPIVA